MNWRINDKQLRIPALSGLRDRYEQRDERARPHADILYHFFFLVVVGAVNAFFVIESG